MNVTIGRDTTSRPYRLFVLTDNYVYPDDYPEVDEEICVVGVFDTYQEGDYTYCTLRKAKLV